MARIRAESAQIEPVKISENLVSEERFVYLRFIKLSITLLLEDSVVKLGTPFKNTFVMRCNGDVM